MFNNSSINLSLPSDWVVEIQQRAEHHHLTAEEWLYVEIGKLLGKADPRSLIEINQRLKALEEQVVGIARLEQDLQSLIGLVKQLSPDASARRTPVTKAAISIAAEEEDEPDEILYDFLER